MQKNTLEVDRALMAELLSDVVHAWTAMKTLAKLHGRQEAKLILAVGLQLREIHQKIVKDVYGVT